MKILIVGKNSFVAVNIFKKLKNKLNLNIISFNTAKKKIKIFLKDFNLLLTVQLIKTTL